MATLTEIATSIRDDIQTGLKGVTNFAFSLEKLEFDVRTERANVIKKYTLNRLAMAEEFAQDINCITLSCRDISECCTTMYDTTKALRFEIPRIASVYGMDKAIKYVGPIDRTRGTWPVYYDHSFRNHSRRFTTGNRPYVWINQGTFNSNNTIYGYVFNVPRIKKVSVVGVFEDPYSVTTCDCEEDFAELRFPMPEAMVKEIHNAIVYRYIDMYKQPRPEVPNTQSSNYTA